LVLVLVMELAVLLLLLMLVIKEGQVFGENDVVHITYMTEAVKVMRMQSLILPLPMCT
jgi:hypothetical protein